MAEPPMDNRRLEECLRIIGWSSQEIARRLDVRENTVRQMLQGKRRIPDNFAAWLEGFVAHLGAYPALPDDWQAGRKGSTD